MIWAALALVIGLASDWPWLWVAFGLGWALRWGAWVGHPVLFGGELLGAVGLEAALSYLRPPSPPRGTAFFNEGAALIVSTVSLGAVVGFMAWQLSVGANAASRLHATLRGYAVAVGLRGIRFMAGVVMLGLLGMTAR